MSQSTGKPQPRAAPKRTRGRTGCLNCRARKKKCNEAKPTCSRCSSFNNVCKWDDGFTFHSVGVHTEHPSVLRLEAQKSSHPGPALRIINVDIGNNSKRRKLRSSQDRRSLTKRHASEPAEVAYDDDVQPTQNSPPDVPYMSDQLLSVTRKSQTQSTANRNGTETDRPDSSASTQTNTVFQILATEGEHFARTGTQNTTSDLDHDSHAHQLDSADLGALDFLTSHASNIDIAASAVQMGDLSSWSPECSGPAIVSSNGADLTNVSSPDTYSIYYPNTAYRELHSTLHQHMVQTARATALNKQADITSTFECSDCSDHEPQRRNKDAGLGTRIPERKVPPLLKCDVTTPRRQLQLWRNYLDEIAPWLDMFDTKRHFQSKIPQMAKKADHLNYSVLALSARQLERRSPERLYTESLGLYQRALNIIVHRLQDLETEVIASCVLLCVLEMMSSSPKAWTKHLDGCAMLLEAAGINGVVGGVRQAIFWCFARMDLWGGYLGDTVTKIPTNRWFIPSGSMASAVSQLKAGSGADAYANYAVFLCASVVNVISVQEMGQTRNQVHGAETQSLYATRWRALYDLLEDWHADRPEELLPLMVEQSSPSDYEHPFPIVLYATSPGVSGNQMYHAAALLMLQHKPREIRLSRSHKSIFWHARQICGIATSNADHNAWTNALQPLWIAGKVMSHLSEHHAILDVLRQIEEETGFATEWRANDLKEYWGDGSE